MDYNENQRLHLEFIESTISRLGNNSFHLKGWCITVAAAFLAIYADKGNPVFLYVATAPTALFWILDSKYLMLERRYRRLYKNLTEPTSNNIVLFSMNANQFKDGNCNFFKVIFLSWSVTLLYVFIIVGFIVFGLLSQCVFPTS